MQFFQIFFGFLLIRSEDEEPTDADPHRHRDPEDAKDLTDAGKPADTEEHAHRRL